MNELARETLVAAALNGVRQVKGMFRDHGGGRCAVGVLMESCAVPFNGFLNGDLTALCERYQTSVQELAQIVDANDNKGWDFLTIARKFGNEHEGQEA